MNRDWQAGPEVLRRQLIALRRRYEALKALLEAARERIGDENIEETLRALRGRKAE